MFSSVDEVKNKKAIELFSQGLSQATQRNLREAISLWRKAIRLEPDWVEPYGHLAFAYFNYGWFSQAIREYRYLIRHGHETAEIHLLLRDIYRILGKSGKMQKHQIIAQQLDTAFYQQYLPHQVTPKGLGKKSNEEFNWWIHHFHLIILDTIDRLRRYPRLIAIYMYPCYLLDLFLIIGIDFWRKYCTKFYNRPWREKDAIQIRLFKFLRYYKKYQPRFLLSGVIYYRNIEFLIALNWVNAKPGQRIIDIGAGQSCMLATLVPWDCEIYITDSDPYVLQLKEFREKTKLQAAISSGRIHIEVADAIALPYPANFFDRVVSIGALEHLPGDTDKKAAAEIGRVLRPGGYALLTLEGAPEYCEEWIRLPFYVGAQYLNASPWSDVNMMHAGT